MVGKKKRVKAMKGKRVKAMGGKTMKGKRVKAMGGKKVGMGKRVKQRSGGATKRVPLKKGTEDSLRKATGAPSKREEREESAKNIKDAAQSASKALGTARGVTSMKNKSRADLLKVIAMFQSAAR